MKRLLNFLFVTVLISSLSLPVLAQQYSRDWHRGQRFNQQAQFDRGAFGNRHDMMMARLNLSDEQRTQIDELYVENQQEMLPLRNELREKQARLRTLQISANYDAGAVNDLLEEIGALRTEMSIKRNEHHQEVRNLLTDEQRILFDNRPFRNGGRGQGMRGYGSCGGFSPRNR
ncbi:Spy/CpxP family protein refolding chaperone [Gracilimonas mengyeensis]|uniref:Heavy-metal resistance n=1 Tax=Gracilimonas mengyeensis TaxID=1302730 RepID=A0A521E5R2_9BACT|nr:Spy/CpxP family protein refolding chaperone [Gracilimonas mengyeensis]SMO78711.1 Heavy-metal resistance [Gracilimonas mengyeensis]